MARRGADVVPVPVDDEGVRVAALERTGAAAAVVTAAHQMPLGVALSVDRRAALLAWSGLVDRGRLRRRVPLRPAAPRRAAGPGARAGGLPRLGVQDARARAAARLARAPRRSDGRGGGGEAFADMGTDVIGQLDTRAADRERRVRPASARATAQAPGAPRRRGGGGQAPSAGGAGAGHRRRAARQRPACRAGRRARVRSRLRGTLGTGLRLAAADDLAGLREPARARDRARASSCSRRPRERRGRPSLPAAVEPLAERADAGVDLRPGAAGERAVGRA